MTQTNEIPFTQVMEALLDENKPFHPRFLYRLSDLEGNELDELGQKWPQASVRRRQAILEDIEEIGEDNYLLSFEALCRFALQDEDARVRELSVRTLWSYEERTLIPVFQGLAASDPAVTVRAAAASALGRYIYLGEIEELPKELLDQIVDQLLGVVNGADHLDVRRRALEALGYSSRDEVHPLIEHHYYSGSNSWTASSLFAMGRSANERWNELVLDMLTSDVDEIRFEAARAAGELEIRAAVQPLMALLDDSDDDIRMAAIWSLSQIGGEGVSDLLDELYEEAEDEDEIEFIEAAIDNLTFTEDVQLFSLFEMEDEDSDEEELDEDDLDFDLFDDKDDMD